MSSIVGFLDIFLPCACQASRAFENGCGSGCGSGSACFKISIGTEELNVKGFFIEKEILLQLMPLNSRASVGVESLFPYPTGLNTGISRLMSKRRCLWA